MGWGGGGVGGWVGVGVKGGPEENTRLSGICLLASLNLPLFIPSCQCLWEEVTLALLMGVCARGRVCSALYSQQGEELEQLVLHLAQLCHWL